MNRRYIALALSILSFSAAMAQTKPEEKKPEGQKGSLTEEIEVIRPYKPVLADAAKIRRSPDLNSYKPFRANVGYTILDKKLELNSDIRQLQAQPLSQIAVEPLTNNYVKAGIGNLGSSLGEVYLNTGNDEALQMGFFVKHLGQSGDLTKQKLSRQQIGAFGRSIQDKYTINGELGFDRLSTYFYGVNALEQPFNSNPEQQRFSTFTLKGELLKNFDQDAAMDYAVKADAYILANKLDARERSVALSSFFNNNWKQFNVGVNASIDITKSQDSLYAIGNHILRANPYFKLQGENYKIALGVNIVQEFGAKSRTNVLPAISAEVPIVPEYATIFAGFTGDVLKSSLREFAGDNPFIARNIPIENAFEKSNIYGGVRGNAGAGFGFKAMVYFRTIENMPLFVNSINGMEKFDVIYDPGKNKIAGLEGEISVKASETLTWTGKLEMKKYDMANEDEAWLKPSVRLLSNARLALNKRLFIDGELVLNGKTNAFTYNELLERVPVSVKSYADLSAGAEYQLKNKIGIFLRLNNIFGTEYQQYLYYPRLGLNAIGGLNYSF